MNHVVNPSELTPNTQPSDIAKRALTREAQNPAGATQYQYLLGMKLLRRDADILAGVAENGALTTSQIQTLYFDGLKSRTSCDTVLRRLVADGQLSKVPIRLPLNDRGAPMGCYQLGKNAWRYFYGTRYRDLRDQFKLMHTLASADVYVAVKQAERAGMVKTLDHATEPDTWVTLGGSEIRPDRYFDLVLQGTSERVVQWIEVDMGTERGRKIPDKLAAYKRAYECADQFTGRCTRRPSSSLTSTSVSVTCVLRSSLHGYLRA